ncbi:MAG: 30S ribosomal protein S24e [Nanoarchaeota archaeon]|nr:30S ribosomal protein S24e [Nanoarchaeota archaeon]
MKLEITNRKKNPLLSREEITALLLFEGKTPARLDVLDSAANALNTKKELVIVKKINTQFGEEKADVLIFKYDSKETLEKLEPEYVKKKHSKPTKKEGEEQAPEAAPAEAPAETKEDSAEAKKEEAKPKSKKEE